LPLVVDLVKSSAEVEARSLLGNARLGAWKMLLDASLKQPFFGFGWGQLDIANFLVTESHPVVFGLYSQSHNLFLDLILWNGYPVGLIAIVLLIWWVWTVIRLASSFEQMHLIAFVMVLGTHAMLEFPLQYAFFLLPFGLIVGALHTSLGFKFVCQRRNWIQASISIVAVIVLAVTINDYFRVERSFYGLRFENKHIPTNIPSTPPDVIALTQFRDYLKFARNVPRSGVDAHELNWMIDTVNAQPSALVMYKLAANLALNKKPTEARQWLVRICKTTQDPNCAYMRQTWKAESIANVDIAAVTWPEEFAK